MNNTYFHENDKLIKKGYSLVICDTNLCIDTFNYHLQNPKMGNPFRTSKRKLEY